MNFLFDKLSHPWGVSIIKSILFGTKFEEIFNILLSIATCSLPFLFWNNSLQLTWLSDFWLN